MTAGATAREKDRARAAGTGSEERDRPGQAPGGHEGHGPDMVGRNIDRIIDIETRASNDRSWTEAASEILGTAVGTFTFVAVHAALVTLWILANTGWFGPLHRFDPYPFNLLSTIASAEAVLLSAVVLIKQNRMSRIADRRDHLDLQVNLLAEQEASMTIQMLDRISRALGIDVEGQEEALELSRTATLEHLVRELHRRFPDS